MRLSVIETVNEFSKLTDEWNSLLVRSAVDNPFQTSQWLTTWWQVYGSGVLHVIVCRDAKSDELLGALPLYKTRLGRLFPGTVLRFMGSGKGSADFLGCLAFEVEESRVYQEILKYLLENHCGWDLIELQDIDSDSLFCQFLRSTGINGMVEVRNPDKCCPYLKLPESWDTLVKGVSKKVRQRIGYYRRALDKIGRVELEQVTSAELLPDALADMIQLRQDRMEQKKITTAAITDEYCRFHGQLMPGLLVCGRLKLYFLKLDGQRIAYLYLFSGKSGIYFYQTGFDRKWSSQSVGFVLLGMVIENSIAAGFNTFEFLRGIEKYKYEWGNVEERSLTQVRLYSRRPIGMACRLFHGGIDLIRTFKRFVRFKEKERN